MPDLIFPQFYALQEFYNCSVSEFIHQINRFDLVKKIINKHYKPTQSSKNKICIHYHYKY